MALFRSDLTRSFAIGFALGTAALFAVLGSPFKTSLSEQMIPAATAATPAPELPDQTLAAPAQDAAR
ncbi:hypothetical protein [Novosphingobium sp.]|uniref:hypothetical protein n=1 Tax=Novosphingobium sp. TaxID=1874826 RepID=UPI0025DAE9A4|nr:hypothetical protein [Novosphingobium sp.]MCC6927257.1 hypothetical protein [Novosphingobium sp.]